MDLMFIFWNSQLIAKISFETMPCLNETDIFTREEINKQQQKRNRIQNTWDRKIGKQYQVRDKTEGDSTVLWCWWRCLFVTKPPSIFPVHPHTSFRMHSTSLLCLNVFFWCIICQSEFINFMHAAFLCRLIKNIKKCKCLEIHCLLLLMILV